MTLNRPDLSQVDPAVRLYIETLEAELADLRQRKAKPTEIAKAPASPEPLFDPSEPPTTINLITISAAGMIKRTPRHFYNRQRRGGMGIFDMEIGAGDRLAFLTLADESETLLLITNRARAFHLPLTRLPEASVRSRGQALSDYLPLTAEDYPVLAIPNTGATYLTLVSKRGHVRRFRDHYFGSRMKPGLSLYDINDLGEPAAACWTAGDGDLFIASRQGRAIRFVEKQVPVRGCLGIRLKPDDVVVAATSIYPQSSVFLLSADGKGILRLMTGFSPNKAPGSGGKVALKTQHLVGAVTVDPEEDLFIISQLSKIIRFQVSEVPAKEGVVQGVNCMSLRGDTTVSIAGSTGSVGRIG